MRSRTYEFFKVGVKMPNETEYTFYNEPYLRADMASKKAIEYLEANGTQTCVARFQIIEVHKPDEEDLKRREINTPKKSPSLF